MSEIQNRPHWGSRFAFVAAAAGSAIGLGNVWKFPYITGVFGGGAFVLVYLLTIAAVGVPIMAAEIMIGKGTQRSPDAAIQSFFGKKSPWRIVGFLCVLSAFVLLSFYSVVTGWTLHYLFLSVRDQFTGRTPEEINGFFDSLYSSGGKNLWWHFVVMVLTTVIVYRGLKGGIETVTKFLMPTLLGILLVLLAYSMTTEGASQGIHFLFYPDFSKLTGAALLEAVGHGFFTLSLGMGTMITYGSYMEREGNISMPTLSVVAADTLIALLAGLVIFPIVFTHGFEPGAGPGLVFKTLPIIFSQIPGGMFFSILFFLLLFFAAFTSAISLLEVVAAFLIDSEKISRHTGTIGAGVFIFFLGILSALSGGPLADIKVPLLDRNFFDSFDYLVTNWLLPIGGLLIAVLVGYALPSDFRRREFSMQAPIWWSYHLWLFFIRFCAPLGVIYVFLAKVGLITLGTK